MTTASIPSYSVNELNQAIGKLLSQGFAPKFFLHATVSKTQLKNGHLWLTLTDGKSTITAVVWSSTLQKVNFQPIDQDGVEILGKLNFWETRASLVVQVLDIKPSISTVLRKFEVVKKLLLKDGLISNERRRPLPEYPKGVAILTSVPSSALADILRTAKERWPITKIMVFPTPMQGDVSQKIQDILQQVIDLRIKLGIQAIVLARGGGNREDLMVFDNEKLCRTLANLPIPLVTGIGHEDDLTVADLVADHRSATPTATIVDLLPSKDVARNNFFQIKQRLKDYSAIIIGNEKQRLSDLALNWKEQSAINYIFKKRDFLSQRSQLLVALSPQSLLKRGFCILSNQQGVLIQSAKKIQTNDNIIIQLIDGSLKSKIEEVNLESKH